MAVKVPDLQVLERISQHFGFDLDDHELSAYQRVIEGVVGSFSRLDELLEEPEPPRYRRARGYRPEGQENPLGAWYWKSTIEGAADGPLVGKSVVIKDNVCVAGIPMSNGSILLEGYVPDRDATIVARILDAGGTIVGKAVCENLCFSGASHTADSGPVRNPHNPRHSAGGSSGGSAALVAAGQVDMAIGGDQGGSIRIPSAWCGIVGLKPTYGLVPYTGVFPIEMTLDHTGPMARTVEDVALLLDVIAGPDGLDPRQNGVMRVPSYLSGLKDGVDGLRVGIVREGFGWEGLSEDDVDNAVRDVAYRLVDLGVEVREISIPWHRDGIHIWNGIGFQGTLATMVRGNSMGTGWKGHYTLSMLEAYAKGRRTYASRIVPTVKMATLLGQYLETEYDGYYYGLGQNLARKLTMAYNQALNEVDVLVMPTTPQKATEIPDSSIPIEEYIRVALNMVHNTCPFDVTGHPSLNMPIGFSSGLPIGMMLTGRMLDEATLLRLAYAMEKLLGIV